LVLFLIYLVGFWLGYALFPEHAALRLPSFLLIHDWLRVPPRTILWVATALSFAGFFLRFWGSAYLTAEVVWSPDALQGRLLVAGPFRFVRNPLYVGNILVAVAIGSLAPPVGWAIVVVGNVWFSWLLASHEATGMREAYGEVYERYRAAVPALLPRLRPAQVEGSVRTSPSWLAGLKSEALMMSFAIAMAVYTATLNLSVFWGIVLLGWIVQYAFRYRMASAQTQS
jgi:protein-S-isoprenylcysteine O-methyltransferase Ste14